MSALVPPPVRYAVLRAGLEWPQATLAGLEPTLSGELQLRLLPAVTPAWTGPAGDAGPSGIALDHDCHLYLSDSDDGALVAIGLDCGSLLALPGSPLGSAPGPSWTGLCFGPGGWLYAADPSGGRVVVFAVPELAARDVWDGFQSPVALACHGGHVLVLDAGAHTITRYDAAGVPDTAFNSGFAPPSDATAVAVGADATIYVGAPSAGVLRFDGAGAPLTPALAPGTHPRALALDGDTLYVADDVSRQVLLFSVSTGSELEQSPG